MRHTFDLLATPSNMAGGGTAPPLKVGDVLLLIGVSMLIGTLIIQQWDIPTKVNAGEDPIECPENACLKGTSRTFSGDVLEISVVAENASEVDFEIYEDGEEVLDERLFSDSNTSADVSYESKGGKLTWKVKVLADGADAEIDVDLKRAYFLDFAPYLLGALLTAAGVAKKNAEYDEKKSDVLDAIIEDEDQSN